MPALKIKDKNGNWIPLPTIQGADGKSAFQQAVEAGYTGTEAAFYAALVSLKDGPFLPTSGGTMTGPITLSGDPTESGSAANKGYVDEKLSGAGGKRVARFTVGTSTSGWTAKDCDYLCDGTDDQVEINAAIQALPETGGEVVILDGTYNITARIEVNKDYTTLTGNGQSTVLKRMWNGANYEGLIHVTSNWNTVHNLIVDGNKSIYPSPNSCGIELSESSSYNTIAGSMCKNNGYGVYIGQFSNNNQITRNTCSNNSGYGIDLEHSSNSNIIICNKCNGNEGSGIRLTSSFNNIISGNICNGVGIGSGNGIYASDSRGNTITCNNCENNRHGIELYSSKNNNNTVIGNICNNNYSGIWITFAPNNTVTGNTCNNNYYGIRLYSASNNTITGNTCIRGTGLASDYTDSQYTIHLSSTTNNYNLIACNNIMGKNYTSEGGTGNTFVNNKYN